MSWDKMLVHVGGAGVAGDGISDDLGGEEGSALQARDSSGSALS